MNKRRNILRIFLKSLLGIFLLLLLLLLSLFLYVRFGIKTPPPQISDASALEQNRIELDPNTFTFGNNWFRKSNTGLYEMYLEGDAFERGVAYGKMTQELVQRQEDHFTDQFLQMVPSKSYLHLLKYFIKWFNRNMVENVPLEYQKEIYGVSFAASDEYASIGKKYHRILNYHAAHDIGHALQSMALVGCTSFATWDEKSEDSSLIIGRNFDFYVGDKFAEEKIVAFYKPDEGHRFMMVTWAGFVGVVSGMNEKGLTVTINAAKSSMPSGSATPVSIVAREILQYAGNIAEAYEIASRRKMFVSESFLIGSLVDGRAAVIEKTPDELAIYEPSENVLYCTNHFQSELLDTCASNTEQKSNSASVYRYQRLQELITQNKYNSVFKTVQILRDLKGINGADIGMGNEKAINQLIAHHSIVFQPEKLKVWVSTAPWQLGSFVAYDLNTIFGLDSISPGVEIMDKANNIDADPILSSPDFHRFMKYRAMKESIKKGEIVDIQKLITSNPNHYHAYVLAGDYKFKAKNYKEASRFYSEALTKEIATIEEKNYILEQIEKSKKKGNLK
ncbi:MAG: peptidase C45 [Saprospiraceae bacterium]|nr:peptidase C45 [Saprospiraceae bacterium]